MVIRDADIFLCRGKGLIAQLIQWGTGSTYSHVAIAASAKLGLVIEAIPLGGVRAISMGTFKTKTDFDLYRVKEDNKFDHAAVTGFLISHLANWYDFMGVTKFTLKILVRWVQLGGLFYLKATRQNEKATQLQNDNDYFCSELCYCAFQAGGLDIVPQIDAAETTAPGDIARSPLIYKVSS